MMRRLPGVDALRAIGVVMVVLAQISSAVIVPSYLSFIETGFGLAVQLFFVIAGFSLCYSYFERLNSLSALKKYYIRRSFRIAPLFYLMIVIWGIYFFLRYGVTF